MSDSTAGNADPIGDEVVGGGTGVGWLVGFDVGLCVGDGGVGTFVGLDVGGLVGTLTVGGGVGVFVTGGVGGGVGSSSEQVSTRHVPQPA